MSTSPIADPTLREAADLLQQQLIYNGEVLDIALDSLRSYKEGTHSLTFLDSGVHLAYSLLRMLERWGKAKGEDAYVRRKKTKRRKKTTGEFLMLSFVTLKVPSLTNQRQAQAAKKMVCQTLRRRSRTNQSK
jgi:hypothetical protein